MSESVREGRPALRVVRGDPTEVELAALLVALAAQAKAANTAGAAESSTARRRSRWSDRAGALRQPLAHGPGAWRASALPR